MPAIHLAGEQSLRVGLVRVLGEAVSVSLASPPPLEVLVSGPVPVTAGEGRVTNIP
jgi:hypothetical protein